jgi:small subunit ribosomal protein S9
MADETTEEATPEEVAPEETTTEETTTEETPTEEVAEEAAPEITLGEAPIEVEPERDTVPIIRGKVDKFGYAMGTGRRKTSVARVRIKEGKGEFTVNGRTLEEYFCVKRDRLTVTGPLKVTDMLGKVDVWIRVGGGGTTGQTGAVILGIARALQVMEPELHHTLAEHGYLTRDSRMVERKKYGFKKARKSFQFSKR